MPEAKGDHYEAELAMFTDAMRHKLRKNQHKGRWEEVSVEQLLDALNAEMAELRGAVQNGNRVETLLEAADVANFAMMVAHVAITRLNQPLR